MITFPTNATDDEILAVVCRWVDLLADGDYDRAQSLLLAEGTEREWPPQLVENLIGSYELPPRAGDNQESRVTSVDKARVFDIEPRPSVSRWNKSPRAGVLGDVHFDLPINGIWSDLTAIFFLRQVTGGMALELFDIHVL
jgi:hypothetical protein